MLKINTNEIIQFKITRPDGSVDVLLMKHKLENKWSFVNLSRGHICPCKFDSVEDAIVDLDSYVAKGKVIDYKIVNRSELYE